jgi:hypothetical protein
MMDDVKAITERYRARIKDKQVFFKPVIPQKKSQNAIAEYANDVDEAEVLVLIDDTAFGKAKDGVVLTVTALYVHTRGRPPKRFDLPEIERAWSVKKRVHIDDFDFDLICPGQNAVSMFTEMLAEIVRLSHPRAHEALVDQAIVMCPACGAWSDIWEESCACGNGLLTDRRTVKILKSSAEPRHLMEDRAKTEESQSQESSPATLEQAVRDLAALRRLADADGGEFQGGLTARITRLLLKLERESEAVAEAMALREHEVLPSDLAIALSCRCEAAGDTAGAHRWITAGLKTAGTDLRTRVPLVCRRAWLLTSHDRAPEAMALLRRLEAEMDAAFHRTEKSGGDAFAVGFWSSETKAVHSAIALTKKAIAESERAAKAAAKEQRAAQRAAEGKARSEPR